jgi:hypothetical protein
VNFSIFAVYDEAYLGYAEMWRFCIRRAYPECAVNCMMETATGKPKWYAACKRLLITPPMYGGEDVYVTDIDMMILPEIPTLYNFHHSEMIETGLCYSNTPRNNVDELYSRDRLTGLHYATKEWYDRTAEARKKYLEQLEAGRVGTQRIDDELILMKVCQESGLGIPPKHNLIKRHHGIHVGIIRAYFNHGIPIIRTKMKTRISPEMAHKWQAVVMFEPEYPKIISRIADKRIKREFDILDRFTKGRMKG